LKPINWPHRIRYGKVYRPGEFPREDTLTAVYQPPEYPVLACLYLQDSHNNTIVSWIDDAGGNCPYYPFMLVAEAWAQKHGVTIVS
jgi:hypothetical protein